MKLALPLLTVVAVVALAPDVAVDLRSGARAAPPGVAEAITLSTATPAANDSLRSAPAFQFICGTGALRIQPASGDTSYKAITVWNAACSAGVCTQSSTPVFLGGVYSKANALSTAVTNTTGMPICNSSGCIAASASYEVENLQCIAGSSVTVTVQVVR